MLLFRGGSSNHSRMEKRLSEIHNTKKKRLEILSAVHPEVVHIAAFKGLDISIGTGEERLRCIARVQVVEHKVVTRKHTNPHDIVFFCHGVGS